MLRIRLLPACVTGTVLSVVLLTIPIIKLLSVTGVHRHRVPSVPARLWQIAAVFYAKRDAERSSKWTDVTLKCQYVCDKRLGGVCVPLELAIFIYRDDVPTEEHTYDRSYPVVQIPATNETLALPGSMSVERCYLKEHFPDMRMIRRQGRCAVVGNGGVLSGSGCGREIDAHDFVVRANIPPLGGYREDVGRSAHLSAFNTKTLVNLHLGLADNASDRYLQLFRRYLQYFRSLEETTFWYLKTLRDPYDKMFREVTRFLRRNASSTKIHYAYSWDPIHIEETWDLEGTGTLGFDMYAVARTFCDNITLYGFFPFHEDRAGRKIPHHYYEDMAFAYKSKMHNFLVEHERLKELEARGELRLVTTSCRPPAKQ